MSKKKFNVGDRVVSKEKGWTYGRTGTVVVDTISGANYIDVKFDEGHPHGWGDNNAFWYCYPCNLKLASKRGSTFTIGTTSLAGDLRLAPQPRRILAHLENGKTITNMEAMITYHISRLSDCVHKLRKAGYDISMTKKRDEVGGKYASYKLAA